MKSVSTASRAKAKKKPSQSVAHNGLWNQRKFITEFRALSQAKQAEILTEIETHINDLILVIERIMKQKL